MYLSIAVVGVRAFALGKAFFRYSERLVLHDATFRKATKRRTAIYSSLVARAPIGLSDTKLGSLLTNLVDDTEESLNEDLRYRPALIQSIAVTAAGVAVYFWLAPTFAWLVVLVLIFGAVTIYFGSRFAAGKSLTEVNLLRAELAVAVENLVARNRVLRAYGWQDRSLGELEKLTNRVSLVEHKLSSTSGLLQSFIALATYLTIIASLWVAVASGDLLPGEQVAVLVLLPLGIYEYLQNLPASLQARFKAKVSIDRLNELQEAETAPELLVDGEIALDSFTGFSIEKSSVTYPGGKIVTLPNMSLSSGESVSLVGESGIGKSTLANVLVGFIRTSAGKFLVNGKPIDTYSGKSMREVVGLVEQQSVILAGTVRDNLLLAASQVNDLDLIEVLQGVELWGMFSNREGLNTEVGQYGSKLSGGEAQRLALARNLLAKRRLIILDEPTSSVDFKQAKSLVSSVLRLAKQRGIAVLLITHDKKLARLTDRLVEFRSH